MDNQERTPDIGVMKYGGKCPHCGEKLILSYSLDQTTKMDWFDACVWCGFAYGALLDSQWPFEEITEAIWIRLLTTWKEQRLADVREWIERVPERSKNTLLQTASQYDEAVTPEDLKQYCLPDYCLSDWEFLEAIQGDMTFVWKTGIQKPGNKRLEVEWNITL